MTQRNPSIFFLSLVSILTFGCAADIDEDGQVDDSDQIDEPDDSEVGTASSELVTQVLGGVDLNAGCILQHGPLAYATLLQSPSSPGAAYAWRCQSGGTQHSIDVTQFCRLQYLLPLASARTTNPDSAYSWQCVISF